MAADEENTSFTDQDLPIIPTSSDADYAREFQLQEAGLASMMMINEPSKDPVHLIEQFIMEMENGESEPAFCGICMENKAGGQIFTVQKCSHVFCNDCVGKHVEAKIQGNTHTIVCPAVNCEEVIEFESCNNTSILPEKVVEKWDQLLCESSIEPSQKYYCPFKDCSAMMLRDSEEEAIREAECPSCHRLFCAHCSVPWHAWVGCEEFQRINEDLMLKELAKNQNWKRCPSCRYYVEKTEGCHHMTCRCGFQFCYSCGATWTSNHGGCQPRPQQ